MFSDIRNDASYSEFYKYYKDKGEGQPIPPPLSEELELPMRPSLGHEDLAEVARPQARKSSTISDVEIDVMARSSIVSTVMHGVVDNLVQEEDSPRLPSGPFHYYEDAPVDTSFPPQFFSKEVLELVGEDVYSQAKDQAGCRLLQKRLDEGNEFINQYIFAHILPHIPELMIDTFGNYLVQKLAEVSTLPQLRLMCESLVPHLVRISFDVHGTRAVQKLVEVAANGNFAYILTAALQGSVVELIKDQNGNHVIQKCLVAFPPEEREFVYQTVSANVVDIATHRQGCCVLQRCIDAATTDKKMLLINRIVDNAVLLVQDAFGNYVVQYVLDMAIDDVNMRLASLFTERLLDLSKQKFSSNVIEKCLQQVKPAAQEMMVTEMCSQRMLGQMLQDQFANYGEG